MVQVLEGDANRFIKSLPKAIERSSYKPFTELAFVTDLAEVGQKRLPLASIQHHQDTGQSTVPVIALADVHQGMLNDVRREACCGGNKWIGLKDSWMDSTAKRLGQ